MLDEGVLRFVPSRVEGVADVTSVAVYRDRLELLAAGRWVSFPLAEIAVWPQPAFVWRGLARAGWRPRWLPVGERDRFKSQAERFYRFYTWPNIVIYMPVEPAETDHGDALFHRVQDVISAGGYGTWELG